eukprot:507599-Hanusia_phi.AAC.1
MQQNLEPERHVYSYLLHRAKRSPPSKDAAIRLCAEPYQQYLKYRAAKQSFLDAQEAMRRQVPLGVWHQDVVDQCYVIDTDLARLEMQKQACILMGMDMPAWLLPSSERLPEVTELLGKERDESSTSEKLQDVKVAMYTMNMLDFYRDYVLGRVSERVKTADEGGLRG